jgi:hypothetical protein
MQEDFVLEDRTRVMVRMDAEISDRGYERDMEDMESRDDMLLRIMPVSNPSDR